MQLPDNYRTSKAVYEELKTIREPYLQRALVYTSYTIRSLLASAEHEDTSHTEMSVGFNTRGPQLINHASNIYMMTLYPPHRSFHKLDLEPEVKDELLKSDANPQGIDPAALTYQLSRHENASRKVFEKGGNRRAGLEALKHLMATGNCLYVYPDTKVNDSKAQIYALDEYVIRRDLDGNVTEIIMLDQKSLLSLSMEHRAKVCAALEIDPNDMDALRSKNVELYTHLQKCTDMSWQLTQEIESVTVTPVKKIKKRNMRWLPLSWNRLRREVYARGLVEDYAPVFHASEVLNEALITGSAITLDFKFLVEPSSPVDIQRLNDSQVGSYHHGRKGDISLIERAKSGDIQAIDALAQRMEMILQQAFLWNAPRDAERVTAEEIRLMAKELERSHGGNYGILAEEWQDPIARLTMQEVDVKFADAPIEPMIITGLDALGRSSVNENIALVFQDLAGVAQFPTELLDELGVVWDKLFKTLCAGRDVDAAEFTMTEAEARAALERKQQQAQQEAQQNQQQQGQPTEQPGPAESVQQN